MRQAKIISPNVIRYAGSFFAISLFIGLIVFYFQQIPIENNTLAMDWKNLWLGLENGIPTYGNETGLRIPPWSLLLVLPLGFLPLKISWGVLAAITFLVLLWSVPKGKHFLIRALLLILSFPAIRTVADGNFEFLVIIGVLLIIKGFESKKVIPLAIGVLLAATKIQETWVLMLVLPFYLFRSFTSKQVIGLGSLVLIISTPTLLWKGYEWLQGMLEIQERGSIMDSSLKASLERLNFPSEVILVFWFLILALSIMIALRGDPSFSRIGAGFFITASLLLSPYAAGNSFLTVYAVFIIPLLTYKPKSGILMVTLTNLPYLAILNIDLYFRWSASYWTLLMLLTWTIYAADYLRIMRS